MSSAASVVAGVSEMVAAAQEELSSFVFEADAPRGAAFVVTRARTGGLLERHYQARGGESAAWELAKILEGRRVRLLDYLRVLQGELREMRAMLHDSSSPE